MYIHNYSESVWSTADFCTHALAAPFRHCCQEKSPKRCLFPCHHGNAGWEAAFPTQHCKLSLCEMRGEPGPEAVPAVCRPGSRRQSLASHSLPQPPCCAGHRHDFCWRPAVRCPSVGLEESVASAPEGWWGWRGWMEGSQASALLPPTCTCLTPTQLDRLCGVGNILSENKPTKPKTPKCWQAFDPMPCLKAEQDWTFSEIIGFLPATLAAKTNAF